MFYKLLLAFFWLLVIVIDLVRNSVRTASVRQGAKYLLYMTRYLTSLASLINSDQASF